MFPIYDICLCGISERLWSYTPCSTHSTGNLDAQYGQLQHAGIYQSSSWRSFGKPGNARVLLPLQSQAPSSQRSGRPALGERKSSRGLIEFSTFIDNIQFWHRYAQHKCGFWEHFLFWSVFHTSDKKHREILCVLIQRGETCHSCRPSSFHKWDTPTLCVPYCFQSCASRCWFESPVLPVFCGTL